MVAKWDGTRGRPPRKAISMRIMVQLALCHSKVRTSDRPDVSCWSLRTVGQMTCDVTADTSSVVGATVSKDNNANRRSHWGMSCSYRAIQVMVEDKMKLMPIMFQLQDVKGS